MALITICTAPKPFVDPHISMIQKNAVRSWAALGTEVEVVLVGDEKGIQETAKEIGVHYAPDVQKNSSGTPIISSIFEIARRFNTPVVSMVNTDILLVDQFLEATWKVVDNYFDFLVVGQRWDLDIQTPLDFSVSWQRDIGSQLRHRGRLHPRGGSDYFIFPHHAYKIMPDLVVGRAGWDNWMIYEARKEGWAVIDATHQINIIHQDHDYSHLPGGLPHYRHPETKENIEKAGGNLAIFTLDDCSHFFQNGNVKKTTVTWKKLLREVEIFPIIGLRSKTLGSLFHYIFHPQKTLKRFRQWIGNRLNRG